MNNLFDILQQAQNGQAVEQMARQFQMNQADMETALAALMPAFSEGFKRNTSDPMAIGNFMQAIASGQHAKYFEDMTNAFQPQGVEEGNGILGHLFGSKEVSRAVSQQAAQATGIGQEIFKQLLPVLASTLMGGMFKQMTGQTQAASAAPGNVFGQVIEQMMANSGMAQKPVQRAPNPMDNPLGQVLEQMFGGGAGATRQAPDATGNPWGKILQDMMGGMQQPQPAPAPAPTRQKAPYEDLFGEMFETGRKSQEQFQDQYQKSMEQVFDNYMRGMDNLNRR
ncbi:MAG: DUF937 domain-containing protein [Ahrensia sp.]